MCLSKIQKRSEKIIDSASNAHLTSKKEERKRRCNINFTTNKAHVVTLFNSNRRGGGPPHRSGGPRSAPVPSVKQRTDALCGGLDLILEHHDAKSNVREALRVQVHSYLDTSSSEQIWLKRCKYLLTYPLARFLKNKPPPRPDTTFKPSGLLRDWMKSRLNAFNPRNVHLWYSWFQAKRSTLPLSETIVQSTYDEHLTTLTSPDNGCDETINGIFENPIFEKVLYKLQRTIGRKFKDGKFNLEMPKTSACFEDKRSTGGQINALRRIAGLTNTDNPREKHIISPEFHSMEYRPWVYTRDGTKDNFIQTKFCAYGQTEWSELVPISKKLVPTVPLSCTIQAVLEPNKIRVISKGNALPYYTCKPLQLLIHGLMKKMPCFRLIGRPLTALDIHDIAAHTRQEKSFESGDKPFTQYRDSKFYKGDDPFGYDMINSQSQNYFWTSVDYSAATDGLSWKYSRRIYMTLISELPEDFIRNSFNVLGPHILYYPEKGGPVPKGIQQNGQLMGSILSFVILCLANLGVYLYSLEQAGIFMDKSVLDNVLINGDDMVYAYPPRVFETNIDVGQKVGLKMSVGKAYIHREYLNINSQSVLYNLHKPVEDRKLKWVNYLNTGLFFGRHKVQGKKEHDKKMELAEHHTKVKEGITENLNCLLEGSLPGKSHDLLKKSLEVHSDKIKQECSSLSFRKTKISRNLFIPKALGGMGVRAPEGWKFFVSKQDQHVAHGILLKYNLPYSTMKPLPGEPVSDLDDWVTQPWEVREDKKEEERFPLHQITFKGLKRLVRCPDFEFYIPNRYSQVVKSERKTMSHKTKKLDQNIASFDPFKLFDEKVSCSLPEDDIVTDDLFLQNCIENMKDQWSERFVEYAPVISEYLIDKDIDYDVRSMIPYF